MNKTLYRTIKLSKAYLNYLNFETKAFYFNYETKLRAIEEALFNELFLVDCLISGITFFLIVIRILSMGLIELPGEFSSSLEISISLLSGLLSSFLDFVLF